MDWKKLILSRRYLWGVYRYAIYPVLKKIVDDSSNKLDDAALAGFDQFARFFLRPDDVKAD